MPLVKDPFLASRPSHVGFPSLRNLLYLSLFFKRHREDYYRRLNAVRVDGDWEGWLDFFLDGVATIADEAVASARDRHGADRKPPGSSGTAKAPADCSLGASVHRPSPSVGHERRMAPDAGLEPATSRLTADCSTN